MAISINLYLDSRGSRTNSKSINQEFPIKATITKDGATAYITTGIKVLPIHWKNRKVTGRKDKARLNDYLDSFKSRIRMMVLEGQEEGRYYYMSVTEIKKDILVQMGKGEKSSRFLEIYDRFADSRNSERTKEIYRVTGRKIRQLLPHPEKIQMNHIDLDWLENLNELLILKGNNGTTRCIDFRNIRAVLRYAEKHKLIQENPFDYFTLPQGNSPNRALTVDQLRLLMNADVMPWERKYLDFFKLSFFLIGMNTEDILHIERIEDGRINYVRAKTHKQISIKVEKEALEIIDKYKGKKYLLNILDTYSCTHHWTAKVDAALKSIANRNKLPDVTMYWARHTWATLACADLGIDLSTISDALGHQPERRVTLAYIKRKDFSKVDEANRKVIDYSLMPLSVERSAEP
ncbi:MAG: phage integrase SAM-like domain-containing protein [Bacteroidales bacterium]|nr:phage integrase SAM-like domain-containing protein [Bacteroidales bacterium]